MARPFNADEAGDSYIGIKDRSSISVILRHLRLDCYRPVNLILIISGDFCPLLVVLTRIVGRSPIMNKRFIVRLSVEERAQLESLVAKGKAAARKLTRGACPRIRP